MVLTNVLGAAYTVRAAIPEPRRVLAEAVTAMAEAVRAERHDSGVRTTLIEPGAVETSAAPVERPRVVACRYGAC